ncbi:MAG: metallophosphoesterase family protein [archaeon]
MSDKEFLDMIVKATDIFAGEPNFIEIVPDKSCVFISDLHGDYENTEKIIKKYGSNYILVFLGDYVDRAIERGGSIKTLELLLQRKLEKPKETIILRGNHEFKEVFRVYGFLEELGLEVMHNLQAPFEKMFSQLPYIVGTDNGLLGLHGGLPNIFSIDQLYDIPKGVYSRADDWRISQIVWNDHSTATLSAQIEMFDRFNSQGLSGNVERGAAGMSMLFYDKHFFDEKMKLLGKNVLVRGHDKDAKGYSYDNRLLTIFSSRIYSDYGKIKGAYVAVMEDPQKELKSALDLKIEKL